MHLCTCMHACMHAYMHACGAHGHGPAQPAGPPAHQPAATQIYICTCPRDAPCPSLPGPPSPRSAASPRHRLSSMRQPAAPSLHPAHPITAAVAVVVKVGQIGVPRERATTAPLHVHACMHACMRRSWARPCPARPPAHQPAATQIYICTCPRTHLVLRIQVRLRLDQQLRHAIGFVSCGTHQRRPSILRTQSRRQSRWW